MIQNYSGKIIITRNLFLKLADPDFLKFTGLDMNASVAGAFAPEDEAVIRGMQDKNDGENSYAVLRLRRADGVFCPVLATFCDLHEDGTVYMRMEMTEISVLLSGKNENTTLRKFSDTYFELIGSIMLKYECVSDRLEIFYISDSRRGNIFEGTLEEWQSHVSDGNLEAEYKSEFDLLCIDLRMAKKNFSHTLKIRGFMGGSDSDVCVFRCGAVTDAGGNENVLGLIETGSQEKMKNLIVDPVNDKDAFLDMLNKRAIVEHAKRLISLPTLKHSFFIILDLDNFKSVNDVFGHITGDEVLVTVTRIINDNLGGRGIVGRIGGDEILIITETIEEQTELRNMLRTIRTQIEWTFKDDPRSLNVTCSIGACVYPENGKDFNTLFELADKMLYIAKSKGKNRYIIYTPELHDHLLAANSGADITAPNAPAKNLGEDKIGIMHRLVDNYLIRHSYNNEKMFSEIAVGFALSEILIVYENFTNLFQWTSSGVTTDISTVPYFTPDNSFGELFNDDKLLVLDGLFKLEGRCPEVEKCLTDKGVKSAMFYRIDRMGSFSGYVMFAKGQQRQMWSENEIMALSTAAKVFDVSMREC